MFRATVVAACVASAVTWLACTSFEDAPVTDSPDATTDVEGGGAPPIADAAAECFFCDDFERTTTIANGWNDLSAPKAAELSLSTLHPKSGTGSLELVLFGDASSGPRTAFLTKELPPSATYASVDFWLHYDEPPSTDTTVAAIGLQTLDGNVIALLRDEGSFVLNEQFRLDAAAPLDNGTPVPVGSIKAGTLRHIVLEVGTTLVDGGPGAKLTVDGESNVKALANGDPRPKRLYFGGTFSALGTRNEDKLWYDDVAIVVK
jgi:hypothetical protein